MHAIEIFYSEEDTGFIANRSGACRLFSLWRDGREGIAGSQNCNAALASDCKRDWQGYSCSTEARLMGGLARDFIGSVA